MRKSNLAGYLNLGRSYLITTVKSKVQKHTLHKKINMNCVMIDKRPKNVEAAKSMKRDIFPSDHSDETRRRVIVEIFQKRKKNESLFRFFATPSQ